jgi:myo-inositol 2-dehydrogenase/D-chiro-inositol 1-dehydrogenase
MSKQITVGVIGAGRIGKIHARNLAFQIPNANVLAVSDVYLEAAKQCAAECRIPKVMADYHAILEDKAIEAIFICSSTDTHARILCESAAAGKHIFCEKPIDYDLGRIDEALRAADKAGVKLQVGFNRRFDPNFRHARDFVAAGKIGAPHIVRITSRDPQPPPPEYVKVSGGLFLDMAIHDFDMCRYLLGEEVTEIYAVGTSLVDPEIGRLGDVDTAVTMLTYTSGAFCTIDNSRKAVYGYDQRIEIFGSEGCIQVDNRGPYSANIYTKENVHRDLPYYFFLERYQDSYLEEAREFMKCIQQDTPPLATGKDGKISVLMGLAAQQSLKEHRPVQFIAE